MRKVVFAVTVFLLGVSLAVGKEFSATVTKVDGEKITFLKKPKNKGEKDEEMTLPVSRDVKVVSGKFNKETKKIETGDVIEGGLKSDKLKKEKIRVQIRTDEDNKKVIEIVLIDGGDGSK